MDEPEILQSCLPELQKVYVALEEPDYVAGVAAIRRKEASLEEMIHQNTAIGNFQVIRSIFNSNHLLIPNTHVTNIVSKCIRNMPILGYHQDKIIYKVVSSTINMSKILIIPKLNMSKSETIPKLNMSKSETIQQSNMLQNHRLLNYQIRKHHRHSPIQCIPRST